jgi:hypothetical protein
MSFNTLDYSVRGKREDKTFVRSSNTSTSVLLPLSLLVFISLSSKISYMKRKYLRNEGERNEASVVKE